MVATVSTPNDDSTWSLPIILGLHVSLSSLSESFFFPALSPVVVPSLSAGTFGGRKTRLARVASGPETATRSRAEQIVLTERQL